MSRKKRETWGTRLNADPASQRNFSPLAGVSIE
jgi:hypothetical protein